MSEYRFIKKKIGELFNDYINGCSFKSENFSIRKNDDMLPVLKIANIGNSGTTDFTKCYYHTQIGYEKFIAHKGDLAFSLTGSLGYVSVITEDCLVNQRVFVIKRHPDYEELLQIIQPFIKSSTFTNYCFANATSESNKNISYQVICDYKVPICVDNNGFYQLEVQKELADKYLQVEEQKAILYSHLYKLRDIVVKLPEEKNIIWENKPIGQLFISVNRGQSKYTKTYCNEHKGEYPVYSANNSMPLCYMNSYDFDGRYLSISINGIAGVTSILEGKFSITADRVVCIPSENISIDYVKYIAESYLREAIKGRIGEKGKNEFSKLTPDTIKRIKIPIPLCSDRSYDLEKQLELAEKHQQIENIKSAIINQIIKLTNIAVQ